MYYLACAEWKLTEETLFFAVFIQMPDIVLCRPGLQLLLVSKFPTIPRHGGGLPFCLPRCPDGCLCLLHPMHLHFYIKRITGSESTVHCPLNPGCIVSSSNLSGLFYGWAIGSPFLDWKPFLNPESNSMPYWVSSWKMSLLIWALSLCPFLTCVSVCHLLFLSLCTCGLCDDRLFLYCTV